MEKAKSYYKELDIDEVELDTNNPRIKMYLETYKEVTSEGIALALNGTQSDDSFRALRESIRVNGGVINPILVNHNTALDRYVVIEGNTRLQIYKDFRANNTAGDWETIRAIVYDDMSDEEIHSIRLQSHMVGPRDWDAYSKAKYLHYLMHEECLPMPVIISYCGGKQNEINRLVDAYKDMKMFYMPKAEELGFDIDYRDFSKFSELQNPRIIKALALNNYTKEDFAEWVLNGNVDTAQNVRNIPIVLEEKAAKEEFFKTNLTEAYKLCYHPAKPVDYSNIDYIDLCKMLTTKLDDIKYKEVQYLQSEEGYEKRSALLYLKSSIEFILDEEDEDE